MSLLHYFLRELGDDDDEHTRALFKKFWDNQHVKEGFIKIINSKDSIATPLLYALYHKSPIEEYIDGLIKNGAILNLKVDEAGRVIYETRFWRGCVNFEDESSLHCTFYGYVNC